MRQFFMIFFAFVLGGCYRAKNIGGMYHLISDDPALQRATLEIEDTRVSGQGPCNRYFGSVVQLDIGSNSIQVGPLASTKIAAHFYGHSSARWADPNDERPNKASV